MDLEHSNRLTTIQQQVKNHNLDALIISDKASIDYYTGVIFDPMERFWLLIIQPEKDPQIIANKLFVFDELAEIDVTWVDDNYTIAEAFANLADFPATNAPLRIGVDKLWRADQLLSLAKTYNQATFEVGSDLVDAQRAIKTAEEQEKMRKASDINDRAMARLIEEVLPLGLDELAGVDKLARIYDEEGADAGFSFEPIIAYGPNGADPHHESDHTLPKRGDSIVIDIGCKHEGYCSDMTRTVYYGEPSAEAKRVYDIVLEANLRGIDAVKVGETLANVDAAARDYITAQGYGDQFTHRLGHFIGREVHEKGDVSKANTDTIKDGNIFSIEPGIYLTGNTAVRIEDLVIAHDDGTENLNHFTKDMIIIQPK
ncbi:MAG: Xaa-Pro peptidase family protein [Aerococcus urinaeequi]